MFGRLNHIVHDLCDGLAADRIEVDLRPLRIVHEFGILQRFGEALAQLLHARARDARRSQIGLAQFGGRGNERQNAP